MEGGDGGAAGAIARRRLLTHNISFFNRGRGAKVDCICVCGTPHHYRTNSSTEETRFRERHLQAPVSPWLLRHFQT